MVSDCGEKNTERHFIAFMHIIDDYDEIIGVLVTVFLKSESFKYYLTVKTSRNQQNHRKFKTQSIKIPQMSIQHFISHGRL